MDAKVLEEIEVINPQGKRLVIQKICSRVEEPTKADEPKVTESRTYYQVDDGGTVTEVLQEEGVFKRKVKDGAQERVETLRPV